MRAVSTNGLDVLTSLDDRVDVLSRVSAALLGGRDREAEEIVRAEYPHDPIHRSRWQKSPPYAWVVRGPSDRTMSEPMRLQVWRRDGFRDRYAGDRLVFPPSLELISILLPDAFPYENPPHGPERGTHQAFYDLYPMVDHVVPVCLAAADVCNGHENLATTTFPRNSYKGRHLLEEIGWTLRPVPTAQDWDGLTNWFLAFLARYPRRVTPERMRYPKRYSYLMYWRSQVWDGHS